MPFQQYEGAHPNLSCEVQICPELGVLRKTRRRSPRNLMNEVRAIDAWHALLLHYRSTDPNNASIGSPAVVSYDTDAGSIDMSFCVGVILGDAITGHHDKRSDSLPRKQTISEIAFGLGRLAAIKQRENVVHGDYRQRHLLFDPLLQQYGDLRLHVIDVESTRKAHPEEVRPEDVSMYDWLQRATSGRYGVTAASSYAEGLHSLDAGEPIWGDVERSVREKHE